MTTLCVLLDIVQGPGRYAECKMQVFLRQLWDHYSLDVRAERLCGRYSCNDSTTNCIQKAVLAFSNDDTLYTVYLLYSCYHTRSYAARLCHVPYEGLDRVGGESYMV